MLIQTPHLGFSYALTALSLGPASISALTAIVSVCAAYLSD